MLLFTLLVTAIISVLTYSVYYFARLERKQVFDKRLMARANYNTQLYALMGDSALTLLRRMDTTSTVGLLQSRSIAIYSDEGEVLYKFDMPGSLPLSVSPDMLQEIKTRGEKYFSIDNRDAIAIRRVANRRHFIVVVAGHEHDGPEKGSKPKRNPFFPKALGLFFSSLVRYLFSRPSFKP